MKLLLKYTKTFLNANFKKSSDNYLCNGKLLNCKPLAYDVKTLHLEDNFKFPIFIRLNDLWKFSNCLLLGGGNEGLHWKST